MAPPRKRPATQRKRRAQPAPPPAQTGILPIITDLLGALPSAAVLVIGLLGGIGLAGIGFWAWNAVWDNPRVYASGKADQLAADKAAAAAQEAAIAEIKAQTEQQLADAQAAYLKQHEVDQNEIAQLNAEVGNAPGAGDLVWDAGVMRHYRNIWAGQH